MDKLLPDPLPRPPPTGTPPPRRAVTAVDSSSPPNPHLLCRVSQRLLLSFLFKKNKPLSPFLPAKEAREDRTNAEDKLPTWPLASLLALQESSHFPTELISQESYRDLWNQGQEVEVKASVNLAPAGLVALSSPREDWLGQADWSPLGFIAQSRRRRRA